MHKPQQSTSLTTNFLMKDSPTETFVDWRVVQPDTSETIAINAKKIVATI